MPPPTLNFPFLSSREDLVGGGALNSPFSTRRGGLVPPPTLNFPFLSGREDLGGGVGGTKLPLLNKKGRFSGPLH